MPRHEDFISIHPDQKDIDVIKWFSQGKYLAEQEGDTLRLYVAKWGKMDFRETTPSKAIFFNFNIYQKDGEWIARQSTPDEAGMDIKAALKGMYRRVWTSKMDD